MKKAFTPALLCALAAPSAWAHPAPFHGTFWGSIRHLLTDPYHLLVLGGSVLGAYLLVRHLIGSGDHR